MNFERNPCPECGDLNWSFGPPDSAGGERYKIAAWYCASCGYVRKVAQSLGRTGYREAKLMPITYHDVDKYYKE